MNDFYIATLIVSAVLVALCPILAFLFGRYFGLGLAAARRDISNNEDQDGNARSKRTSRKP